MAETRPRRIRVRDEGGGTTLRIRTKPFWVTAGPAALILAGLAGTVVTGLDRGWVAEVPTSWPWAALAVLSAAVLMVACFLPARVLVRALFTREVVRIDQAALSLRRGALRLGRPQRYALAYLRRLRASPESALHEGRTPENQWHFVEDRNVAFDYGPRTIRFGLRLSEAEANYVVGQIRRRVPVLEAAYKLPEEDAAQAGVDTRATVSEVGDVLRFRLPTERDWVTAAYLGLWIAAWIAGVVLALLDHPRASRELLVWLAATPIGLLLLLYPLLWAIRGEEVVTLDADTLTLTLRGWLVSSRRRFPLNRVSSFRVSIQDHAARGMPWSRFRIGNIAFTDRGRTYRFGIGVDEAEAEAILRRIEGHLQDVEVARREGGGE